ncbi:hypothetical protein Q7P37_004832 [Cladosporium fusiforme]
MSLPRFAAYASGLASGGEREFWLEDYLSQQSATHKPSAGNVVAGVSTQPVPGSKDWLSGRVSQMAGTGGHWRILDGEGCEWWRHWMGGIDWVGGYLSGLGLVEAEARLGLHADGGRGVWRAPQQPAAHSPQPTGQEGKGWVACSVSAEPGACRLEKGHPSTPARAFLPVSLSSPPRLTPHHSLLTTHLFTLPPSALARALYSTTPPIIVALPPTLSLCVRLPVSESQLIVTSAPKCE